MIASMIKKWWGGQRTPEWTCTSGAKAGINPDMVSTGAYRVVDILQERGFAAFVVGGAVRDMLLGERPKDFDVATDAKPDEIKALFRRAYIIGRRFRIVHVHIGAELIEVTTFRGAHSIADDVDEQGRILSDNAFGTQLEDASRRDFSVNALYYDPHADEIWDAHEGLKDLRKKHLRLIGQPAQRFREDPVRILRALRFCAKLNFSLDRTTQKAIHQLNHLLESVPSARLADEFAKFLMNGYAQAGLAILQEWRLLHLFLENTHADEDKKNEALSPLMHAALSRADARYRIGQRLSLSFLLAALLWEMVQKFNAQFREKGLPPPVAMQDAMNEAIHRQWQKVSMTKAVSAEIRELWLLQHFVLFPRPRQIPRLITHRRLTAALDFIEWRAGIPLATDGNPSASDAINLQLYPALPTASPSVEECRFWAHWWRHLLSLNDDERRTMAKHWEQALSLMLAQTRKRPHAKPSTTKAQQGDSIDDSADEAAPQSPNPLKPRKPRRNFYRPRKSAS